VRFDGVSCSWARSAFRQFYSRNLATEVTKGLQQKAAAGGTISKAPLGYLNVRERDVQGREVRTVVVRAPGLEIGRASCRERVFQPV
jgi:DNA invertase Pin-like site-specific DNA recombinase